MKARTTAIFIAIAAVILALVAAFFWLGRLAEVAAPTVQNSDEQACRDFSQALLEVGEKTVTVALATTPAERARGLAGCTEIPAASGMYFVFAQAKETTFWMKDMLIPLDIVWLADQAVIGIEKNVPPPAQPDGGPREDELPQYHSPGAVDAVLELSAGEAERLHIDASMPVLLK
jgi:uncharacterized membrane protein (UPF0127 family)